MLNNKNVVLANKYVVATKVIVVVKQISPNDTVLLITQNI